MGITTWTEERVVRLRELRIAGQTNVEIAQAMGMTLEAINKAAARHAPLRSLGRTPIPPAEAKGPEGFGIIDLEKVTTRYDIRAAIFRELGTIPEGKLILESELCARAAGTDKNRFRRAVENNEGEFRPFRIKLHLDEGEARWYWGRTDTVQKAMRIRDL